MLMRKRPHILTAAKALYISFEGVAEYVKRAFSIRIHDSSVMPKRSDRYKKALIVYGDDEGHRHKDVAQIMGGWLREEGFDVTLSDTLDSFLETNRLKSIHLIVLIWTRGTIQPQQLANLLSAVHYGVGFAGIHSTIGAFRGEIDFHHMIGGQFLAHPGGADTTYTVHMSGKHPQITQGLSDFTVTTEKYYMMLDPAICVLAWTCFGEVEMPVAWTKSYGHGRDRKSVV